MKAIKTGKKAGTLPNAEKKQLLELFRDLPTGRSNRNSYIFTPEQATAVRRLRQFHTPKNLEIMLDISVYKIHKLINYAKHIERCKFAAQQKAARLARTEPPITSPPEPEEIESLTKELDNIPS